MIWHALAQTSTLSTDLHALRHLRVDGLLRLLELGKILVFRMEDPLVELLEEVVVHLEKRVRYQNEKLL